MLSKKADLKNSEVLGLLGASIICAKQGCEADGPEITIGPLKLKLYQGTAKTEPKKERRGQLSLLDLTKGAQKAAEAPRQKPAERPRSTRPAKEEKTQRPPSEAKREEARARSEEAARQEAKPEEKAQPAEAPPRPGEARRDVEYSRLLEAVAESAGLNPTDAKRVLDAVLLYLASYPSVGILRFLDDVRKSTKADPDVLKRVLNVLRAYDVVELHELGVVNLKKKIEVKRETKL